MRLIPLTLSSGDRSPGNREQTRKISGTPLKTPLIVLNSLSAFLGIFSKQFGHHSFLTDYCHIDLSFTMKADASFVNRNLELSTCLALVQTNQSV